MAGKAHRKATGLHWDLARVIAKLFLIVAPAAARLGEAPVPAPPALLPLESEELLRGGRARTVEFWQNWSRSLKSLDVSYSSDPSLAELQVGWGKRVWISGPQASYRQLVLVLESSILEILRSTFAGFRMLNVLLLVASGSPPPELSLLVLLYSGILLFKFGHSLLFHGSGFWILCFQEQGGVSCCYFMVLLWRCW